MSQDRWFILCVLFVARFSLGFQFQSAGSVTPFIVQDFGVDYTRIGTLVGLFMIPGLFLAIPSGFIGKRFSDKRTVLFGLALMTAGGGLMGAADTYEAVVVGRLISGAGATFLFVLMTKMVIDWFVEQELFVAMSIFIIGWPVGIAAGQAVQGIIADASSWNVVFYLTSMSCLAAFVAISASYRSPPDAQEKDTGSFTKLSVRELWLIIIAGFIWMFINGAYVVFLSFGPTMLLEQGATVGEAGATVSLMSWMAMFSLPLGGYLATRYRMPNIVMLAGLGGATILGGLIPYVGLPILTFAVFGVALGAAVPVISALPAEALRPENRGPGLGIYYVWFFMGSAFLPIVGGYMKDATSTAAASLLFGTGMLLACILLLSLFRTEQARIPVTIAQK